MINHINFYAVISGKSFRPSTTIIKDSVFEVEAMNDPNGRELIDQKDTKDSRSFVSGSLTLSPKKLTDVSIFDKALHEFLTNLTDFIVGLREPELDLQVHINIEYKSQCNFELSKELVKALSSLGAILTISCYEGN
jgi:hypothetical protein